MVQVKWRRQERETELLMAVTIIMLKSVQYFLVCPATLETLERW